MNRWLRIIILTLLVVLKSTATISAATFAADDDHKIQEWVFEHQQRPQAIISDSSQTFRLCSSRPQRVIPAEYAKQVQRYSFRLQSSNLEKTLSWYSYGRHHIKTSRLSLLFSCEYYVFALKHLLC